jgi:hypothetical protein
MELRQGWGTQIHYQVRKSKGCAPPKIFGRFPALLLSLAFFPMLYTWNYLPMTSLCV